MDRRRPGGARRRLVAGPVRVENDSKLAALAETWRGVARYAKDVVFLLAGLRTGTGLIIDGKLHRGFGGAAGEIGALPAVGWIRAQEHLSLAPGQSRRGRRTCSSRRATGTGRPPRRGAALRQGPGGRRVGAGAGPGPELVVIGGGFSRSADVIVEPLRRELDRWCIRTPEIRVSAFGDEGGGPRRGPAGAGPRRHRAARAASSSPHRTASAR